MWLVAACAALALAVLGHAVLSRLRWVPGNGVVKFVAPGGLAGLALIVGWLVLPGSNPIQAIASVLAFAGCCELYIFLFTLVSTSISSRLLMLLAEAGGLSLARVEALYREEDMVNFRLEGLVRNGLLVPRGDSFALTPRARSMLGAFERLRRFFRHAAPTLPESARRPV